MLISLGCSLFSVLSLFSLCSLSVLSLFSLFQRLAIDDNYGKDHLFSGQYGKTKEREAEERKLGHVIGERLSIGNNGKDHPFSGTAATTTLSRLNNSNAPREKLIGKITYVHPTGKYYNVDDEVYCSKKMCAQPLKKGDCVEYIKCTPDGNTKHNGGVEYFAVDVKKKSKSELLKKNPINTTKQRKKFEYNAKDFKQLPNKVAGRGTASSTMSWGSADGITFGSFATTTTKNTNTNNTSGNSGNSGSSGNSGNSGNSGGSNGNPNVMGFNFEDDESDEEDILSLMLKFPTADRAEIETLLFTVDVEGAEEYLRETYGAVGLLCGCLVVWLCGCLVVG